MRDELPRRRSLDSLKKEAKRWLTSLRANVDDARARLERALQNAPSMPTLRDVQHALALEHGFPGWMALKDRLTADAKVSASTLERYETMAEALLEAYRTGTPAAMERHYQYTWHRRAWQGMRTYVQLGLGKRPNDGDEVEISLDAFAPPGLVSPDEPAVQIALEAFEQVFGRRPLLARSGGTEVGAALALGSLVACASAELLLGQAPVDADREEVIATWVEMVMGLVEG